MTKEEILEQANQYAKESTCGLSYLKGFPLSAEQILGFLEIFYAWQTTAKLVHEEYGDKPNAAVIFSSVYEDFTDFLDTDIPLNPALCIKVLQEYTANKLSALYIMKNGINTVNEITEAESLIRRLMEEQRWEELQRITEIDKLCQEN